MKTLKLIALLFLSPALCKAGAVAGDTTVDVVQRQVDAYNARNIDAFADTYADTVKFYNFPDKYLGEGKEFIRKGYTSLFLNYAQLHCEIRERIVQGNTVIDKESVTISPNRRFEAVAMYQVDGGKIVRVFFLR